MFGQARQQRLHKALGIKFHQVVDLFTHTDKPDGQTQVFPHADDAAAFGSTVQLSQHYAGGTGGLDKFLGLADGVLSGDGIQHQQHLQTGFGACLFDTAGNFGKLVHQTLFVVQTSRRVGNDHVIALGRGALDGIKDDRSGVCPLPCLHQRHLGAVCPQLQLLTGGCAEGIARRQHDPAPLIFVQGRQLGDGGGFAHAVYADDQNHGGLAVQFQRVARGNFAANQRTQSVQRLLPGFQVLFLHLVAQLVHQTHGAGGADIGQNELFFQLIVQIIVNFRVGQRVDDVLEKARAGFFQTALHFLLSLKFLLGDIMLQKIKKAHKKASYYYEIKSALTFSRSRRKILETPSSCMVTPYSTSAASMVPRRWVMTMNWVFSVIRRRYWA